MFCVKHLEMHFLHERRYINKTIIIIIIITHISLILIWHTQGLIPFINFGREFHRVGDYNIGIMDLSDHSPVYPKLNMEQYHRNTLWRLNIHILNHMKDQIKRDIREYLEHNDNGEVSPPIL